MTGLEITLFILGTAFIIISFFIVDNSERTPKAAVTGALDADALEQLRTDFTEKSAKEADFILHETEDKLEAVSNDKIIAVGEYSDQILEKIDSNHKEVVFLYQMLNEKEEELKTTATKMDNIRIECEKLMKEVEEAKNRPVVKPVQTVATAPAVQKPAAATPARTRTATAQTTRTASGTAKAPGTAKPAGTAARTVRPAVRPASPASVPELMASEGADTGSINRNDEIISLYKSGKSIMEISKLLGMGQGEVKLIIDLYC